MTDDVVFFEIGSKPLADMGVLPRKPSDVDWFGPGALAQLALEKFFPFGAEIHSSNAAKTVYRCYLGQGKRVMLEVEDSDATPNSRAIYDKMLYEYCDNREGIKVVPAKLDWLLFFKESHKFKKDSVHFLKTLNDIKLLYSIGAQLPLDSMELLEERERLTYTNKLPNLNVTKGEFFDPNTVQYKYDHDSLHEAVKINRYPAYWYYKPAKAEVFCSEDLFWNATPECRLAGVYEEACVLALERSMIPFNFKPNPDKAFATALEKVCTSITSGWFRDFAYNHYHDVWKFYHAQGGSIYVQRFLKALESGIILPFSNPSQMMA